MERSSIASKNKKRAAAAVTVKKRDETFTVRVKSKICQEVPAPENPYIAERVLWHGYDVIELMRHRSLVDVIFLLIRGELPSVLQAHQLEQTLVFLANPGPRHSATRSVMNASVSKANPEHLLPIGLALLGGECLGAAEVRDSIKFLRKNMRKNPEALAAMLCRVTPGVGHTEGEALCPAPGYGSHYSSVDSYAHSVAAQLASAFPKNEALNWGKRFAEAMAPMSAGWHLTGVAAAMFVELGFTPNAGAGLYQLAACPGLLAHGIELSGKPITAMPFASDDNYHYEGAGKSE